MSKKRLIDYDRYELTQPWPEDCYVQGGSRGLVMSRTPGKSYNTAFVEAFPTQPATFIRGEGPTLEEAEKQAWAKYERVAAGDHEHEYEDRGYRNGAGFCKHCDLFTSNVFTPTELGSFCSVCETPTFWTNVAGQVYCETHAPSREERSQLREEHTKNGGAPDSLLEELLDALLDEDDPDTSENS